MVEMLFIMDESDPFNPVDRYKINKNEVLYQDFEVAKHMLQYIGKFITGETKLIEEGEEMGAVYYFEYFDIPNPALHDLFFRICFGPSGPRNNMD